MSAAEDDACSKLKDSAVSAAEDDACSKLKVSGWEELFEPTNFFEADTTICATAYVAVDVWGQGDVSSVFEAWTRRVESKVDRHTVDTLGLRDAWNRS